MTGRSSPLAGKKIVLTRPEEQARALAEALRNEGAEPVLYPVIAIVPTGSAALRALAETLERYWLAFFVSANAVDCALSSLLAERLWPEGLSVAAVGQGTARALRRYGFERIVVPESGFDSEAVLALEALAPEKVKGKKILVFRGDGGRALLGDTLTGRGADVEYICCYRRVCPQSDPAPLLDAARRGELDAVVLTSSEGARNFVEMTGNAPELRAIPVFAIHSHVADAARAAGFGEVHTSAEASDAGLVSAMKRHFSRTGY